MIVKPTQFGLWAIEAHKETNHFYEENLPYDYHLSLAVAIAEKFKYLLKPGQWIWIVDLIWGHDLMEDARKSYNDILKVASLFHTEEDAIKIAEGIRALTNYGRGRNRTEKMPDYIYREIRETEGATFAKVAGDRCANVKHGLISDSGMRKKYTKENPHFKEMLYTEEYKEIWDYLEKILIIEI